MRILADNENEIIWERSGTIKVGSLKKYGRLKIYLVIFLPQDKRKIHCHCLSQLFSHSSQFLLSKSRSFRVYFQIRI